MLFGPYSNNMCEFAIKIVNQNGYCLDLIKIVSISIDG